MTSNGIETESSTFDFVLTRDPPKDLSMRITVLEDLTETVVPFEFIDAPIPGLAHSAKSADR